MVRVIANRRARRLRQGGPLSDELFRRRTGLEVVETSSLDALDDVARAIAAEPGPVLLAGGDGSYMAGLSALARAFGERPLPPIGLLPGGTVCSVARNWGLGRDHVTYTRDLLDAVAHGTAKMRKRPTLRVGERVGFIFGSGLVARFFEAYEKAGAGGTGTAARIVAAVFGGSFVGSPFARRILSPMPCHLGIDDETAPFDRVSLVCASVVRDLGLGMKLLYRAGERHDRFHVVATPLGTMRLGPQMPLVLAGRPLLGPKIDALARSLVLRFEDGRGVYVLDGDLFHEDDVEVRPGPVIDVLTP